MEFSEEQIKDFKNLDQCSRCTVFSTVRPHERSDPFAPAHRVNIVCLKRVLNLQQTRGMGAVLLPLLSSSS